MVTLSTSLLIHATAGTAEHSVADLDCYAFASDCISKVQAGQCDKALLDPPAGDVPAAAGTHAGGHCRAL